jgi:sporulation protein YlmC with PRC-barrel domain
METLDSSSSTGRAMSGSHAGGRVTVQGLLGCEVIDAAGKKLGRVREVVAERCGDELCVTHFELGTAALLERLGPWDKSAGRRIAWEEIAELGPPIRLRERGSRR